MSNPLSVTFHIFPANDLDLDALSRTVEKNIYTSTTYEDIIRLLQLNSFFAIPNPFMAFSRSLDFKHSATFQLKKGETFDKVYTKLKDQPGTAIFCIIEPSILKYGYEILLPPEKKPSSASPSLSETITTVATPTTNILIFTASIATIIQTFIVVQERWEKTHQIRKAGPPQQFPQSGKTDIYAIRLRMTDGRDHTMQQWLHDPDELKHFIDVFNQPSSQLKPTEVVFVLWNKETIVVDVTKGTQGNLQLDEMLKYLKIGSVEK